MFIVILTFQNFAQSPDKFNYQAVIVNDLGQPLTNQDIDLRLTILAGGAEMEGEYVEEHHTQTHNSGLVNVGMGEGIPTMGDFLLIDWSRGEKFIKVEFRKTASDPYSTVGISPA